MMHRKIAEEPCNCGRLKYPHRRAWQCETHEDQALSERDDLKELIDSDNVQRARDMNNERP